jgi:hypothetical protein
MRTGKIILCGLIILLLVGVIPVIAFSVESVTTSDNGNKPTVLIEHGTGKEASLIKVTHIHYVKSEAKSNKPPKTSTCYSLAGWKWSLPVTYTISPGNPDLASGVGSADSAWDAATSAALFTAPVGGSYPWGVYDGKNSVSYGNYPTKGVIAVTTTWYNRYTKQAVESDILFDTDFAWGDATGNSNVMDIQNIATHEIGHTLGLNDLYSTTCIPETMYGYSGNGETSKRTLEIPDITGLKMLYGA